MIKGVLFDMDGVLSDSEEFICNAALQMFLEFGMAVQPEDFKPFTGTGENRYIGGVAEKYGVHIDIEKAKARTYEIYINIVKGKLKPLPGALEFVYKCRDRGFRLALATSTDYIKMKANLDEIGLPAETFMSIITGHDVVNKKPAPDIYVKAADSIRLEPEECLVVEDAVNGVTAAGLAGCKCLAVTTSFRREDLAGADWICNSLKEVPLEALNW
ncbi:MAG TPA: HAD-IA family hydrolase [Bacteroidales bacterium]|nr:HAD-IA family hydrolase [Bacteroidales bacterium]